MIVLTGATGGIGSAIKSVLREHPFQETKEIDWLIFAHGTIDETNTRNTFEVNTFNCIHDTELYLPFLKRGVIYISSTAALTANSKFPIYSASKAALNTYAKAMQKAHPELEFYALCPGPTNTKMWQSLGIEGETQEPIEVAKVVKRIIDGEFKGNVVITVRNGEVLCV